MTNLQLSILKKAWLWLCFFLFLTITNISNAQNQQKIDSLIKLSESDLADTNIVKIYYELSIEFLYYNKDVSKTYANKSLNLSKAINYKKGEGLSFVAKANICNVYGEYEEAIRNYLEAINIFEDLNEEKMLGKIHGYLGDVYGVIGSNDFNHEINRKQCLSHHLKAIEYLQKFGNSLSLAKEYSSLGNAYVIVDSLEKALFCYQKTLNFLKKNPDNFTKIAAETGIAGVYYKQNKHEESIDAYRKCLEGIPAIREYERDISIILHDMAMPLLQLQKYDEALDALDSSLNISKRENDVRGIRKAYSGLDNVYYAMGDYKNAYEAYNEWVTLEQNLLNENTQKQINELKEKYESEKKEKEIANLNLKNEKLEAAITESNNIIAFSTGIFILIILLIILFIKQQKTKELKKRAELEQRALRTQMNPHFIFNSLNSIQRMFMEGNFDLASNYMGDFGQLLRIILENSGKKQISIKDEINTLKLYLEIEKMRTDNFIEYKIDIDPNLDILNNFMPPLIIQPFVENAIWHGILPNDKKGNIIIDLSKKDKRFILCTIIDNGIGINKSLAHKKSENHNSKGMKITKERLNSNQSVVAEELEEGGTKITILIPLS